MQGSIERVTAVVNGEMPDRAPLFDLLRNDAVIEHFTGRPLTVEQARESVYGAYAPAIDATRPTVKLPTDEATVILDDGREQRHYRWTSWTQHKEYRDSDAYEAEKRIEIEASDPAAWNDLRQADLDQTLQWIENEKEMLGDLVEAGIDGLNPIEVLAGMDVAEIHRRYPHLFMCGGIDVSQLLPFGSPSEVRDAVKRAIDDAGGRIMIGSSTELNNEVPLENFRAMREAVLEAQY